MNTRLAQHTDVPQLAQLLYELKPYTGWSHVVDTGWSVNTLIEFIRHKLLDPGSVVYVCDDQHGMVTGFCGVTLGELPWPPYSRTATEWAWGGGKREATSCWQAARRWAKAQGVEYLCRVSGRPGTTASRVTELVTWEVL